MIREINPSRDRHRNNSKSLIESVCRTIELQDGRIAGYFIMSWDDRGSTSMVAQSGGAISTDLLPTHVLSNLPRLINK